MGWACSVNVLVTNTYTLNIVTDDGMNVLIDGNLVLWAWYDQGPTAHSRQLTLSTGSHTVTVQYYNNTLGGTAQVMLNLAGGGIPGAAWLGEYFSNPNLAGTPTLVRVDPSINFNWGSGSPDPTIPSDFFSVRWTRTSYYAAGTWNFTTTTDDGVRLYVDGQLVIDQWHPQSATSYTANVTLGAGNHTVQMQYYEAAVNAVAQLNISPASTPPPSAGIWHGQYFNNVSLSGAPVFSRDDPAINFNWGLGSPDPRIPSDYFSTQWDSTQVLPVTGSYTISATSDDGVAVWVNGLQVINGWYDHPPTSFTTTLWLGAGPNNFHVDYYERTGGAQVTLTITPPGGGPPPPPPSGDVIVDDNGPGWQAGGCLTCWRTTSNGFGGDAFWTFNNTYALPGYDWARWYPPLRQAGNYEVFAFIPGGVGNTTDARYWIYHNGAYNLSPLNQGIYWNQWVSLGTYYFNAAGGENVSLTDVTYECYLCRTIVFDAIKFSPR